MKLTEIQQNLLKMLPGVDHILEIAKNDTLFKDIPKTLMVQSVRETLDALRLRILEQDKDMTPERLKDERVIEKLNITITKKIQPKLKRVINATGVVVHTNLGRSLLAPEVLENLRTIASRYSNLEFDLAMGKRGSRYSCVEEILCEISGAEAAMVVNNNAGAVFLSLETLAKGKNVIVSRGELVEIGGAFRIPDVMARSGAILKEIGTTNRTHFRDYENAIDDETGLLLKVHTSNYSVVGFTASVPLRDLVPLAAKHQIPVMEDLGSGNFIDFSRYGMIKEPTVQEAVGTRADLVTFSGDKMLGGPQAGIILGKKEMVDRIRKNPINRALRIDKLTLAALESTLRVYRDPEKAVQTIPTLRMLTTPFSVIEKKAEQLAGLLKAVKDPRVSVEMVNLSSRVGGGALPLQELPSRCVAVKIKEMSANSVERFMRNSGPPVIGRIEDDCFIMDPRTIEEDEIQIIGAAFSEMLINNG